MGLLITNETFQAQDYQDFMARVRLELEVLQALLQREGFGEGPSSIGAEVEFYIVGDKGRVRPINTAISEQLNDPLLTVELNRFNLEYNLSPQPFAGAPFLASEIELQQAVNNINAVAAPMGGKLVSIGILPTLKQEDFRLEMMTDTPRYRVLAKSLREQRGGPFRIDISGEDSMHLETDEVTLEGANTSYQLHWRVPAERFADYYNAVQLITPLALALGANSPGLFQKNLWDETRVALFTQSIDSRSPNQKAWRHPPRVYFGNGWLRHAWEAFAVAPTLYSPLIPIVGDERPWEVFGEGGVPELAALKLHHGTTWPWNRAVYDEHDNGHLRIEMRALPAGPTPIDMSANGLFLIGAAMAMLDDIEHIASVMPFHYAEHNFYRAAKNGLDAELIWPGDGYFEMLDQPVADIIAQLLPPAEEALAHSGLAQTEVSRLFDVLRGRLACRMSGARWQRDIVQKLRKNASVNDAYTAMLERYMANSDSGLPLHEWSVEIV